MPTTKPTQVSAAVELEDRTDTEIDVAIHDMNTPAENASFVGDQMRWLRDYAKDTHSGMKALAGLVGTSFTVFSQLYSGKYNASPVGTARKIAKFRDNLEKRRIYGGKRDFISTAMSQALWRICEKTRYNRRIQSLQSEEQMQKTRSLSEYTMLNNSGRTAMVTLQKGGTSKPFGIFLRDLAQALGIQDITHKKVIDLRYKIREKLKLCDLVIIDEFHMVEHWTDQSVGDLLDYLRTQIHSDGERGVLLVATNSDTLTFLNQFKRRSGYNLGQLLGRMRLQPLTIHSDDIPFADVELFVKRYLPTPRKATLTKLHDITTRPKLGHFGLLLDILNEAWSEAQLSGIPITDDTVLAVAKEVMADIHTNKELYA